MGHEVRHMTSEEIKKEKEPDDMVDLTEEDALESASSATNKRFRNEATCQNYCPVTND